jgi:hypothetical protein
MLGRDWAANFEVLGVFDEAAALVTVGLLFRTQGADINGRRPFAGDYGAIAPTSFQYTAEKLGSDDKSWQLYLELFGKRSIHERSTSTIRPPLSRNLREHR